MTTGPDSCEDNFDEELVPFELIACAFEHSLIVPKVTYESRKKVLYVY